MLTLQEIDHLQELSPSRSKRLFNEFLPIGYGLTTLSNVTEIDKVVGLKVILGSIITLYDDYADRPDQYNPRLLDLLYKVPFERVEVNPAFLNDDENLALKLAKSLFDKLFNHMSLLPNQYELIDLFYFDLQQFFLANRYAEHLTKNPYLANQLENKSYLHHNMGIVMAGMIDLMSLPNFDSTQLGLAREIFLLGQRSGRISNVVSTFERELAEGDVTNEILSNREDKSYSEIIMSLNNEHTQILKSIGSIRLNAFDSQMYAEGMRSLHKLHLNLKGVI